MLRANQAVRLGLRAASRNPELAFGKALLDQAGNLLALLPLLLAGVLLASALGDAGALQALLRLGALAGRLRWPLAGALLTALAIAWALGILFWSGALPLLAADAEMDARPPPGNFALLASRGFARVAGAGAIGTLLSLSFGAACTLSLVAAAPALLARPSPTLFAGAAFVLAAAIVGGVVIDLLARLMLVRAAALGDGPTRAFGAAASLLLGRLGSCLLVAAAFLLLELLVATAGTMLTGVVSGIAVFDGDTQLLALAPRIAAGLATGVVFAWLEVGRQGALAAIAADAEGLIEHQPEPGPRAPAPAVLERPRTPEPVIDALPVDEQEPVREAEPVPEAEPVIDALPDDEPPGDKKP
jgi:hypothetical protein